jgi:hypothetical protein
LSAGSAGKPQDSRSFFVKSSRNMWGMKPWSWSCSCKVNPVPFQTGRLENSLCMSIVQRHPGTCQLIQKRMEDNDRRSPTDQLTKILCKICLEMSAKCHAMSALTLWLRNHDSERVTNDKQVVLVRSTVI